MGKLQRQMRQREKSMRSREGPNNGKRRDKNISKRTVEIRTRDKRKTIEIPTYDSKGKAVVPEKRARQKKAAIAIGIMAGIGVFVYSPQFFMGKETGGTASEITVETNHEAIRNSNTILREHSLEDFDGDGVLNADEISIGTDPWRIDTDGDQVTDYAELHITNTSPTEYTGILMDIQMKQDKADGKSLAAPYRIGNLILWPDSYESKAYGSVVETSDGAYRFCNYSGSVLFPEDKGQYAYKTEEGIHTLLEHDLTDNTWTVSDGNKVSLYDRELEEIVEFRLFGQSICTRKNFFTKILGLVLPDKGWISARRMTREDTAVEDEEVVCNELRKPLFKESDYSRLMSNMTTIGSLGSVRSALDDGKCVAVSLYNSNQGEYLAIIYGYTEKGDLLISGMKDESEKGRIEITEKAEKLLNEEGEIVSAIYFDWQAFGFSSENNDRISFFAVSNTISARGGEVR